MLRFRALLVVLALVTAGALAGCFGKDDEADGGVGDGTTDGATTDGDGDDTGGGDTTGGTTGGNTTTPPPPPRPNDVNETFSIALQGQAASGEHPFNVPATGWNSFTVTVGAEGPQSGVPFLADSIEVVVLDPTGAEVGSATFSAGPPSGEQQITVASGPSGGYIVRASATTAAVSATVSGTIAIDY